MDEKTNYPNYIDAQHSFYNWSMGFDSLEDNGCGAIATPSPQRSLNNTGSPSKTNNASALPFALVKYVPTNVSLAYSPFSFESRCRNLKNNEMAILCYWYLYKGKPLAHNICILKEFRILKFFIS